MSSSFTVKAINKHELILDTIINYRNKNDIIIIIYSFIFHDEQYMNFNSIIIIKIDLCKIID